MDNQQEISPIYGKSSETLCNITYNFDNYFNLKPLHKNKINKYFYLIKLFYFIYRGSN